MVHDNGAAAVERGFWPAVLVIVSAVGTVGFACVTPFAAFAVAAAYALPPGAALLAVGGVWLANQAIGYAVLGYPVAPETMLWGLAIGVAALAATAAASWVLRRGRGGAVASLLASLAAAFAVYEALLYVVTFALGGAETFSAAIVGRFALLTLAWAATLVGAWEILRLIGPAAQIVAGAWRPTPR